MAALSTLNQGSEKPATEPQSSGQPTVERLSTASPAAVPPPGPPPATKPQKSEQPEWSPALENQLLRTFGTWLFGLGAALTFVAGISAYFINTAVIENANAKAERAALDRISDIRRQMDAIDSRMTDLTLKLNDNVSKIST